MKKMVKFFLITVLVAIPALGTYVKTTLPKPGSAPSHTIEGKAGRIVHAAFQESKMACSIPCSNSKIWSELADPKEGLFNRNKKENDFPVNFLFNAIPLEVESTVQPNKKIEKTTRKYLIAGLI